jgi:hypothetical protein
VRSYIDTNLTITGLTLELQVPDKGVGSFKEMVEYVQEELNTRTDMHDDISSAQLAHAIVESILNRMRVSFLWQEHIASGLSEISRMVSSVILLVHSR